MTIWLIFHKIFKYEYYYLHFEINLDKFGFVMKNFGKGLLLVLFGFGVFLPPGLTLLLAGSVIPEEFDETIPEDTEEAIQEKSNEGGEKKKEDPSNKGKQKIIKVICDIDPGILNLKSKGKWITAYIEFNENFNIENIDTDSIQLIIDSHILYVDPESPNAIGDYDNDGLFDLMIKFNRSTVISAISSNPEPSQFCEMTITGDLNDGGVKFDGTTEIELLSF